MRHMLRAIVAVLLLAACAGGGASGASDEPIKVGAVSGLTGPVVFPEASAAAAAVFERVNREGGINGRPIEYLVEDDKLDPAVAAQAARKLVDEEGVVAMVGSASVLECSVNADFYAEREVSAIQGTGVDPVCFSSPVISPVNTGPFLGITVSLYYASEVLGYENVCAVLVDYPGWGEAYTEAVGRWEELTGKRLLVDDRTFEAGPENPTPFVLKVAEAGCDAVVFDGIEPAAIAFMQAVREQRIEGIDWLMLTAAYTENVAEALGPAGEGMYANSEFEPFTGDAEVLEDWRTLMTEADVALTSFAQGGYLAATYFVQALNGIDGEITRASVAEALRTLEPISHPFVGTPYEFGDKPAHNSNRASKFVQVRDGRWETVTDDWIVLDEAS